ncbi:DegT/DnrJ/EryC1/StrS family aminotransferase [Flavobacterium columnare]|uniref:DegT/DnrJ/EryC1/StrS family aminotransferase n=1 Tax=Flavobacterium columnare TaxID=996 RepID=A0AAI8CJ56_9FLAO|nr:DegT/DnrJ/EryC1/StrS family aminotransferase [Flavobacterium columnare]AMO21153.1 DegT/DnrJ/EryC1/StrS family aminotransferase [Flavobacterium columnare]AUX19174.1 pyridoxal-5'-phosphate-dependent protein [Flavobacterium columnare]QOG58251.1 DegT/DnrJ/EryC1/StrS family aminotransferase [Flavobacterium columnare]QOG60974.1 DegT/DnrJ/EryC1/StrS family aminotransferase [Flavobacterium columnare]QOG63694.1 DegT/DnrJ/EryC1/StrS family aminotransferase [Flavobacterium columnare]
MIPIVKPFISNPEELMPAIQETLYSGYIAEGEKVYEFEKLFSDYINNPLSLSLNSGTAALHIALLLAGVGVGDEVISTVLTAEPTNVAIKLVGAKVVWADVQTNTGLLDPKSVREKITPRTKAIILVHYAGMVCDMNEFVKISNEFNIPIIEDAAHALGAKYNGLPIGCHSDYTIFSLQAIKHLTTIDGGILSLKSKENYDKGKLLRWFGLNKNKARLENDITVPGYKYHMNNVNATIGIVQMKHVEQVVGKYITNGKYFDQELKNILGIELLDYNPNTEPSYWLYTLKVENRKGFIKKLAENNIMASELHLRNDRHSLFNESKVSLPVFDEFYKKMVHIPCGWWLTDADKNKIVEVIRQGW